MQKQVTLLGHRTELAYHSGYWSSTHFIIDELVIYIITWRKTYTCMVISLGNLHSYTNWLMQFLTINYHESSWQRHPLISWTNTGLLSHGWFWLVRELGGLWWFSGNQLSYLFLKGEKWRDVCMFCDILCQSVLYSLCGVCGVWVSGWVVLSEFWYTLTSKHF